MATKLTAVNPVILKWARERAGLSVPEAAALLSRTEEQLLAWETGADSPTYSQLENIAYSAYKRPIAVFFFPSPPSEPAESEEFRTLPEFKLKSFSPDTHYGIREAKALQLSLFELGDGQNPSKKKIFSDIKFKKNISIERVAEKVRKYLGIDTREQTSWANPEAAFKAWRDAIQDAGVFVFKRPFKQTEISGFCLVDEEFPVIVVSNSTAFTRQSFTLHHELAHILLGHSGVTTADTNFIDDLIPSSKKIEVFANAFAAELLVPTTDFNQFLFNKELDDEFLALAARRYHVSREVILRRLLEKGLVSRAEYDSVAKSWSDGYKRRSADKKKVSGGDYYASKASYLGKKYLDFAFEKYNRGYFDSAKLAEHLDIKQKSVTSMEDYYLLRIASR